VFLFFVFFFNRNTTALGTCALAIVLVDTNKFTDVSVTIDFRTRRDLPTPTVPAAFGFFIFVYFVREYFLPVVSYTGREPHLWSVVFFAGIIGEPVKKRNETGKIVGVKFTDG